VKLRAVIFSLVIILLFSLNSASSEEMNIYPIIEGGLYGYMDREGNLIIPYQFNDAGDFSEGLASVCFRGEIGFPLLPPGIIIFLHFIKPA